MEPRKYQNEQEFLYMAEVIINYFKTCIFGVKNILDCLITSESQPQIEQLISQIISSIPQHPIVLKTALQFVYDSSAILEHNKPLVEQTFAYLIKLFSIQQCIHFIIFQLRSQPVFVLNQSSNSSKFTRSMFFSYLFCNSSKMNYLQSNMNLLQKTFLKHCSNQL